MNTASCRLQDTNAWYTTPRPPEMQRAKAFHSIECRALVGVSICGQ